MIRHPLRAFRRHPRAGVLFVVTALLTLLFAVRVAMDAMFWEPPGPRPLEPWMTMGLAAHMHGLDPRALDRTAGLPPPGPSGPLTFNQIANARGVPVELVLAEVEAAIAVMTADPAATGPDGERDGGQ